MNVMCKYTELRDIHKLVPNPKNFNKHSEQQIEMLSKIIDYQGFRHPIILSKRSGFIVAGHGRLEASKKLGYTQVPIDEQDFANEAEEHAFLIADNKIAELAETDDVMLNLLALDIANNIDLDLLGMPDFKLDDVKELKLDDNLDENKEYKEKNMISCPQCAYEFEK